MSLLSISRIRLFKACRRAYELKYLYALEPVQKAEALETGTSYHACLEAIYKGEPLPDTTGIKEAAMAEAYRKHVLPIIPARAVKSVEVWRQKPPLRGRLDGILEDGRVLEHKTTSLSTWEYETTLDRDEQILAYMWLTGTRETIFTVCRKPTIRQKNGEEPEEFLERLVAWYDEDTPSKIRAFPVRRTDKDIKRFDAELHRMAVEMSGCRNYYRNTSYCHAWGRECEYAPICMADHPERLTFVGYERREATE